MGSSTTEEKVHLLSNCTCSMYAYSVSINQERITRLPAFFCFNKNVWLRVGYCYRNYTGLSCVEMGGNPPPPQTKPKQGVLRGSGNKKFILHQICFFVVVFCFFYSSLDSSRLHHIIEELQDQSNDQHRQKNLVHKLDKYKKNKKRKRKSYRHRSVKRGSSAG